MYDLIVIGGGPAGLTATIYALRKRLNVLLVSKDLGGMTNYHLELPWIEEYLISRGTEVVGKFKSELEYLDFARHLEPVEKITRTADEKAFSVHTKGGGTLETRAIIIATGTRQQRLGVPGEKEYIMRGLCYSAMSYAPQFIDRTATVVGNGDLALKAAAELSLVAKHVHLVRTEQGAGSSPLEGKLRSSSNVTILDGFQVTAVKGDQYAKSLVVKDARNKETEIFSDGTFIEMGLSPNSQLVADLVELDERGRIKVDSANHTSLPGIFAAGDVTNVFAEQVLIAVGEGAKAALSAYEYLLPLL